MQGWSDALLSEVGEAQAVRAGRALASAGVKPGLVGCSDLLRARRTAELLAGETGYEDPLLVDPELREQDLGNWNGLNRTEIKQRWPSELAERDLGEIGDVPGGETGPAFAERCLGALARLSVALFEAGEEAGEEVAIAVTHGGVMIALERALGCWRAGVGHPNLSGWWLDVRGPRGLADMVVRERVELKDAGVENATRTL